MHFQNVFPYQLCPATELSCYRALLVISLSRECLGHPVGCSISGCASIGPFGWQGFRIHVLWVPSVPEARSSYWRTIVCLGGTPWPLRQWGWLGSLAWEGEPCVQVLLPLPPAWVSEVPEGWGWMLALLSAGTAVTCVSSHSLCSSRGSSPLLRHPMAGCGDKCEFWLRGFLCMAVCACWTGCQCKLCTKLLPSCRPRLCTGLGGPAPL